MTAWKDSITLNKTKMKAGDKVTLEGTVMSIGSTDGQSNPTHVQLNVGGIILNDIPAGFCLANENGVQQTEEKTPVEEFNEAPVAEKPQQDQPSPSEVENAPKA